jgi:hypothetical protein
MEPSLTQRRFRTAANQGIDGAYASDGVVAEVVESYCVDRAPKLPVCLRSNAEHRIVNNPADFPLILLGIRPIIK